MILIFVIQFLILFQAKSKTLDYHSQFGVTLSAQCRDMFKKKELSVTDESWKAISNGLERLAKESMIKITAYKGKYQELSPYIDEWLVLAQHGIIVCTSDNSFDPKIDYAAYTYGFKEVYFPYDVVEKFSQSETTFWGNAQYNWDQLLDTYIHEFFHHTSANNLQASEHSRIERIPTGKNGKCGEDSSFDRISVVSSLCSGNKLNFSEDPAIDVLSRQMKNCPGLCERLFTMREKGRLASKGLAPKDAQSLCKRIQEDSKCGAIKKDSKKRKAFLLANPEFQEISGELKKRLEKMLPPYTSAFSMTFIESFPELKENYEILKSTECFQSIFEEIEKEGRGKALRYTLKFNKSSMNNPSEEGIEYYLRNTLSLHYRYLEEDLKSKLHTLPACQDGALNQRILNWVNDMENTMERIEDDASRTFSATIEAALQENITHPFLSKKGVDAPIYQTPSMNLFYTKVLLKRYFEFMRKHDPLSFSFDCEAEGLSPFRTAEKTSKLNQMIQKRHQ